MTCPEICTLVNTCQHLKYAGWRSILLLDGPLDWRRNVAQKLIAAAQWDNGLSPQSLKEHKQKYLGQEFDYVYLDSQAGLSADLIAALSGTIKAGGLLIIGLDQEVLTGDPALMQALPWQAEPPQIFSYFNQRLIQAIKSDPTSGYLNPDQTIKTPTLTLPSKPFKRPSGLTQGQQALITASEAIQSGYLTVTADRGRGKSVALAHIAQQHLNRQQQVIVTAPAKRCLSIFYQWLSEAEKTKIKFIAADEVAQQSAHSEALLIIDEAAALPVPLLKQMIEGYQKVVCATTVHGYEGSGRGFDQHFIGLLKHSQMTYQSFHLTQAIRWAEEDPLENWLQKTLLLQHQTPAYLPADPAADQTVTIGWIEQAELAEDPSAYFQLLAKAHYRTTPEDLKYILDSPFLKLAAVYQNNQLVAVTLVSLEGGLPESLALECCQGKRRPNGHLTSQILAAQMGELKFAQLKGWRIVRIAVIAGHQDQGIGSQLLSWLTVQAHQANLDYLSASFSASHAVTQFWHKNNFVGIRLSHTAEHHSGLFSLLCIKPIKMQKDEVKRLSQQGFEDLLFRLQQYQNCNNQDVWSWLASFKTAPLSAAEDQLVNGFIKHSSNWQACCLSVLKACLQANSPVTAGWSNNQLEVFSDLMLWRKNPAEVAKKTHYAGQKALIKSLRKQLQDSL